MQWLMMAVALGAASAEQRAGGDAESRPPERVRSLSLKPNEPCPAAAPNEVVVCHRLEDPYRIPKPLRRSAIAAATQSWVNRAATIDEVGRVAGGLPDTCSVIGTGGQTGCTQQLLRQWAAERRAKAAGEEAN